MRSLFLVICLFIISAVNVFPQEAENTSTTSSGYQYKETRDMVLLVKDAASLIESKGEIVFPEFKQEGNKWRHGDTYIFILDTEGNMILHPDPMLERKNQIELKDANNKLIKITFEYLSIFRLQWQHHCFKHKI
jgi:uncharacterized protein YxjI